MKLPPKSHDDHTDLPAETSMLDKGLKGLRVMLMSGGSVLAGFSAYLSGAYIFEGLSADGLGFGDYVMGIGSGLACFGLLASYHYVGTHVLPFLKRGTRAVPVAAFLASAALVFSLSTTSNFLQVTRGPVRVAEQNRVLEDGQAHYLQSAKAAREIEVLIPIVRAARETTRGLYKDEYNYGAICLRGAGKGRCAAELAALATQLASIESALIDSAATTTRLTRRGEDILSDIQRLRSSADYSWAEKDAKIRLRLDDLGRITDEINQSLPVSGVEGIVDAFRKPWLQIGFSPEGAAKMTGTFSPLASRLSENTVELRGVRHRRVVDTSQRVGIRAAIAHMDKVGVQAALALMIDTLPLLAILILLLVQWGHDDNRPRRRARGTLSANLSDERTTPRPNGVEPPVVRTRRDRDVRK